MPVIREKPKGECCCIISMLMDSYFCPDLDDKLPIEPKCKKYDVSLSWTRSGKILKCESCLKDEER